MVESLVKEADVFLASVTKPFDFGMHKADIKHVVSVCETIIPHLKKGNIVIIELIIPLKTYDMEVRYILENSGIKIVKITIFPIA